MLKFLWSQLVFWDRISLYHSLERHSVYNYFFSQVCVFSCGFFAVSFRLRLSSQKSVPPESLLFKSWFFSCHGLETILFSLFVQGNLKCHSQEREKQQHQGKNLGSIQFNAVLSKETLYCSTSLSCKEEGLKTSAYISHVSDADCCFLSFSIFWSPSFGYLCFSKLCKE